MKLEWVRGHAADRYNNEVDNLARTTAERIRDGKPVANQPHPFITGDVRKLWGSPALVSCEYAGIPENQEPLVDERQL